MALYKKTVVINSLPLFLETFMAFYQLRSINSLLFRSPYTNMSNLQLVGHMPR